MSQITLTRTNQRKMKEYADATGTTVAEAVNTALKEWFDTYGVSVLAYSNAKNLTNVN